MSRVITFSRVFPDYHPRAGDKTHFITKIWQGLFNCDLQYYLPRELPEEQSIFHDSSLELCKSKYHTIRAGHRWKVGDWFSPRAWSDKPYNSKQIIIAPDIQIKKIWDFDIELLAGDYLINGYHIPIDTLRTIANNDGFQQLDDFKCWFPGKSGFIGQMICWNENISY